MPLFWLVHEIDGVGGGLAHPHRVHQRKGVDARDKAGHGGRYALAEPVTGARASLGTREEGVTSAQELD